MNWLTRVRSFLVEVRAEMKKVSFPSRSEVISTSIVVVVTSAIYGLFLWIADIVIVRLYEGILQAFGA